eukprot:g79402.t1
MQNRKKRSRFFNASYSGNYSTVSCCHRVVIMHRTWCPVDLLEWVADSGADSCMTCDTPFTCFFRRHHCRYCGFLVCSNCSDQQIDNLRACNQCYVAWEQEKSRQTVLMESPALNKLKNLSPVVQFKKEKGHKSVLESPIMKHMRKRTDHHFSEQKAKGNVVEPTPVLSKQKALAKKFKPNDAMIVIDPFSTGSVVAAEILARGVKIIRVFSDIFPDVIQNLVLDHIKVEYVSTIVHEGDLNQTMSKLLELKNKYNFLGATPGCETGVELADAIAEGLELRTNGTATSELRRNKWLMNERVREAGIPAVLQTRAQSIQQVEKFLAEIGSPHFKIVIKPVDSAGSDGVFICRNADEVRKKFNYLMGGTNILGKANKCVVLQEFLEGKEYVIDTVSRDGVHKCLGVWEYDKRQANGGDFVYFGTRAKFGDWPRAKELIEYQFKVLDALGIMNGAGHGEVMYTPNGPRLVEVGARCHGCEGVWVPLARKCWGYSQVDGVVDIFLNPEAFFARPDVPPRAGFNALKVDIVSWCTGTLKQLGRLDEMRALKSFYGIDIMVKPGDKMVPTKDLLTSPGGVRLLSESQQQLEEDFDTIRKIEREGLFVLECDQNETSVVAKITAQIRAMLTVTQPLNSS